MFKNFKTICPYYSNIDNFTIEKNVIKAYNKIREETVIIKFSSAKNIVKSTYNNWLCQENNIAVPIFNNCLRITDNNYLMEYEYVEGLDLLDYINIKSPIPKKKVIDIFEDIYQNIEKLRKINYVHLDLKPENIIYNYNTNHVVIIDLEHMTTAPTQYKNLKNFLGTVNYQSPELLQGKFHLNTDLWNLGMIGFVLLMEYNPIQAKYTTAEEAHIFCYEELIKNNIEKHYCNIIQNLLQPNPENRSWNTNYYNKWCNLF